MKLVMENRAVNSGSDSDSGAEGVTEMMTNGGSTGGTGAFRKYKCDYCHTDFPNKTIFDRHTLFCKTLADIRRGSGGSRASVTTMRMNTDDDPVMPTQREMFILIQELAMKYNKVKEELDVMKNWAKMVGRRVGGAASSVVGGGGGSGSGGGGGGGGGAIMTGLDFTSITRQKRQNMEVILNEEDAEHPDIAELRPTFTEWLATPPTLTSSDLNIVFHEDLVAGITAAILRVMAEYTAESGKSHLIPFKLADIKQGAFYIYDTAFKVNTSAPVEFASDPPIQPMRRWRAMEPCEFQLLVRTFHKLLFQEFKKWQDENWDAQKQITQDRQSAASSYKQMMASCDVVYDAMPSSSSLGKEGAAMEDDDTLTMSMTPMSPVSEPILSEDFATLYNKYADKMMGGALSDETILTRVRAKLWKDMKAWRL